MRKIFIVLLLGAAAGIAAAQTSDHQSKIDAMLAPESEGPPAYAGILGVVLSTKDGDQKLEPTSGTMGTTYAFVTALVFADFSGLHANVRINDPQPTFHILMGGAPDGRIFLVKLAVNDRSNNRSVKLGRSGFGSYSGFGTPDPKWMLPITTTEVKPATWTVVPNAPLAPGEYGIYAGPATLANGSPSGGGGWLYAFGVDG